MPFILRHVFIACLLISCRARLEGLLTVADDPASQTAPAPDDPDPPAKNEDPSGAIPVFSCLCSVAADDADGDCEPDIVEDTNKNGLYDPGVDYADLKSPDTDGDGILDGCEDRGHDGILSPYPPESSPTNPDSDGDGILDGQEDANKNGRCDRGETCNTSSDTDADNIPDGAEDRNHNGVWDCPERPDGPPCETNARERDSDGDGLLDSIELKIFAASGYTYYGLNGADGIPDTDDDQTIPWEVDSDADGLTDGQEDRNADGRVSTGESNPRKRDSDTDGLDDGVEDSNRDGIWDALTETDPSRIDTDNDGLTDGAEDSGGCLTVGGACSGDPSGCVCAFWHDGHHQDNESDPRAPDSDGDGLRDSAEDRNGDGVCQLPATRDVPRASDETCAYKNDSDGDSLLDGAEDVNANGVIDAALGETDARRGDPDNDCLTDPYELFIGTDPFLADSDDDGLPDGLEVDRRLRFDPVSRQCIAASCTRQYTNAACPNPTIRDSDGDGLVDGFERINGINTGEDEDGDGCYGSLESNPCSSDALDPPVIGEPTSKVCTAPGGCQPGDDLRTCDGLETSACQKARKVSQSLICAEGNVRPVVLLRSAEMDYSLALTGRAGPYGVPESLYQSAEARTGSVQVGHLFQSNDPSTGKEAIRSTFGGIVALTRNGALSPSDVAADGAALLGAQLQAMGLTVARTAGGNTPAHDDESTSGKLDATRVLRATDRFVLRRSAGVDSRAISNAVASALVGATVSANLPPATGVFTGPVAELKVTYYKRNVKQRVFNGNGSSLIDVTQFGALWAVAALDADCASLAGDARSACRERNENALNPIDDMANGSALARYQAEVGRGCDPYDPRRAKVDFLVVIDDSGSMQENIIAIQRAVRDVALKLRNNSENMDWRIGMTTSNMGGDRTDRNETALLDAFEPGPPGYPELNPASPPAAADSFFAYQSTAFDDDGSVKPCRAANGYSLTDPLASPYCCNYDASNPLAYLKACCSLPQNTPAPAAYAWLPAAFTLDTTRADASNFDATFSNQDTLRCYDFPRLAEDLSGWAGVVDRYPLSARNPTTQQRRLHFNDHLCGTVADGSSTSAGNGPMRLWGTRGFLWPPGFTGVDLNNPRLDGANLLIRNADMLVMQMNRDCSGNDSGGGNSIHSPRSRNGSGSESMLQAAKRAVERATANGRNGDAHSLRPDAPLITLILSDEEDYSTKFKNVNSERDRTQLPPARCLKNGDIGCSAAHCQGCFASAIDQGNGAPGAKAIPAARRFDERSGSIIEDTNGAYCVAPIVPAGAANTDATYSVACPPDASDDNPFCATSSQRYNGLFKTVAGDDNGFSLAEQQMATNHVPEDVLNYTTTASITCGCGDDCQPCMRYLRERQYVDFFGGQCSPASAAPTPEDPRRYPRPTAQLGVGSLVLPLGPVYAITRAPGVQGGSQGSCGSSYGGGDGLALRDVALATGGAVADVCEPSFADFLDRILVDAQGIGSPYRLRGKPISSTIRVGVMDRTGNFRMLKRSSVSGFDYNAATNTIGFFSKGQGDESNQVTLVRDAVVYVSYRVWQRPCPNDCALGDVCAVCTCSPAHPECCTLTPTHSCQPPTPCPLGCGPCEECDFATNACRPANACGDGCGTCTSGPSGLTCGSCPPGSVGVQIPCEPGSEGACPAVPITVCVTQQGTGGACAVTTDPKDCCGLNKNCSNNEICVVTPCAGESCLPTALCKAPLANKPDPGWCGTCPVGTVCAPIPCQGESCTATFGCIASNPGGSATCSPTPECSCPGRVCGDCDVGQFCTTGGQCENLCPPDVSVDDCCANATCCPAGERYDPATDSCTAGGFTCNCPPGLFCDPFSGRCLPRGG